MKQRNKIICYFFAAKTINDFYFLQDNYNN